MSENRFEYNPRFSDVGILNGGILSDGYGIVSQKVMRDTSLPRDARMMYSYLMTFMNGRASAFPGVDLQIEELQMSRKKYYEMRGILEERDLIRIGKGQRQGQRNAFNIYYFNLFPNPKKRQGSPLNTASDAQHDNEATLACDSGKATKPQVAQQFHCETVENPNPVENEATLACDSGKATKPQVAQQFHSDTVHSGTPNNWTCSFIHTPNSIQPDPRESSRIETAPEAQSVLARSDGRMDGAYGTTAEDNHAPSPAPATDAEAEQGWAELSRSSVNRNLIRAGKRPYLALLSLGYSISEIQHAWDRRQEAAKRAGRDPRYYPQLKKWLESDGDDGARSSIERIRSERGGSTATRNAPRSLSALARRDEAFGRIYWAYCDARQRANQAGVDPERDAECVRLKADMDAEWHAARKRLAAQIE